jgi:hypothetical protein
VSVYVFQTLCRMQYTTTLFQLLAPARTALNGDKLKTNRFCLPLGGATVYYRVASEPPWAKQGKEWYTEWFKSPCVHTWLYDLEPCIVVVPCCKRKITMINSFMFLKAHGIFESLCTIRTYRYHSWFVFGMSWVQISTQRPAILTDVFFVFLGSSRRMQS